MLKLQQTLEKIRNLGLVINNKAIGLIDKRFNDIVMQNLDNIKLQVIKPNLNQEILEATKKAAVNLIVFEARLNNLVQNFVCVYKNNCYELAEYHSFCKNYKERIEDVAESHKGMI